MAPNTAECCDNHHGHNDDGAADSSERCSSFDHDLSKDLGEEDDTPSIANAETKTIRGLKLFAFLVLIISAIGVSLAVYFYIANAEDDVFEQQYEGDATKVLAQLGASLEKTLTAIDTLVVSITSHANSTNQTWPFVTIPNFAVRAKKTQTLANGVLFNLYPYVLSEQRRLWEPYSADHNYWVEESLDVQEKDNSYTGPIIREYENWNVIYGNDEWDKPNPGTAGTDSTGPYLPSWQTYPVIPRSPTYNWDLLVSPNAETAQDVIDSHQVSLTAAYMVAEPDDLQAVKDNEITAEYFKDFIDPSENPMEPMSDLYYPIIEDAADECSLFQDGDYNPKEHKFAGILAVSLYWRDWLKDILPSGENGIIAVFENECNPPFTYQINGPTVQYLGTGDFHDPKYDYLKMSSPLLELRKFAIKKSTYSGIPINEKHCPFVVSIYPSDTVKDEYTSTNAIVFSIAAALIFVFTSMVFILYDVLVERRQRLVMKSAEHSNAIVSSLFPSTVRDRVFVNGDTEKKTKGATAYTKQIFKRWADDDNMIDTTDNPSGSMPIADLFPETTVFFADIAGFTSWSSGRQPSQVFVLLETLYGAFDSIAAKRGVFKVETIGDCYVAVTGLPKPQKQHAVILSRFAADCRLKMEQLTRELELTLGPGTSDLKLRIGLHSGPVTAGVLRGQKARFQLFGDTVNTASRMESTGQANRIHISEKTAELIIAAGKGHWCTKRETLVTAKGKGTLQTYWLEPRSGDSKSHSSHIDFTEIEQSPGPSKDLSSEITKAQLDQAEKESRLVDWNVTLLQELLRSVVAHRNASSTPGESTVESAAIEWSQGTSHVREEVTNSIVLPVVDNDFAFDAEHVELSAEIMAQLRGYVTAIASCYRGHAFHNFEHASHVAMSANTIIEGMISVKDNASGGMIVLDPLTRFAIVLAALASDVDHPGISNDELVKGNMPLAARYKNKSVTEQNSIEIAWGLLMDSSFADLQKTIYTTGDELRHFRQVFVNAVMATDTSDEELNEERKERWEKAFGGDKVLDAVEKFPDDSRVLQKASIAIEFIIQAASLFHTMQHWNSYQKWSKLLFQETYHDVVQQRLNTRFADEWCGRELSIFDNVVIPLASKMREFEIFGVDQFLFFALENRKELENQGRESVQEWVSEEVDDELKETVARQGPGRDVSRSQMATGTRPGDFEI